MYGYWFGMSFIWWIVWAVAIVAFFAWLTPVSRRSARRSTDPLEILRRRYAAGEITTAEYDERRARLLDVTPRANDVRPTTAAPPPPRQADLEHRTEH